MVDAATGHSTAADGLLAAAAADRFDPTTYLDGAAALEGAADLGGARKLLDAYPASLQATVRYHLARAKLLTMLNDTDGARAETAAAAALDPANALVRGPDPVRRN
jgi:hypothetical protein